MSRYQAKFAIDLALWTSATLIAFVLRLESSVSGFSEGIALTLAIGIPLKAAAIWVLRLPNRSWHRMALYDLFYLGIGVGGVSLVLAMVSVLPIDIVVPRSVPFIEAMVALLLMSSARVAARVFYERRGIGRARRVKAERRVLIVGAGEAGTLVAREMRRHATAGRQPVGFLDDDPVKRRQRFGGLPVLGRVQDMAEVVEANDVDEVLIAIPSASGRLIRTIVERATAARVSHRTIPGMFELVNGTVSLAQTRDVNIHDLLGRDPIRLDTEVIQDQIRSRRILVTGAGGSIGSEIVRQLAVFGPSQIVLLGRGENSVYLIHREMKRRWPEIDTPSVICDVRDRASLKAVFDRFQPELVYHAAAHKHVPLMEANPEQAVFNNVMGTRNVAELARDAGVTRLVNISTDKAVNPTSVMGTSKRVAEYVVESASRTCGPDQAFVSVRFGNVLGSRGSVVPLFKSQIERGGPVTVTHPEMIRYFMTIPEASQLVLQAGAQGSNGQVYVLDMGEPVKIVDLARDLILLSGLEPGVDIQIEFSGTRPGEKLFEELLTAEEGTEPSPHEKIFVARKACADESLELEVERLIEAARGRDGSAIREAFRRIVPSYTPTASIPPKRRATDQKDPVWLVQGDGGVGASPGPDIATPSSNR
ncbi:MAG: nucleoside-diphosphate sugar epimerase/dehydratase [Rubricoccaceae bacterium]